MRAALIAAAAVLLSALGAWAQSQNCVPHDVMVERLAERFGETRQSIGVTQRGAIVEIFASVVTGTWTITVTSPDGAACMVAAGESFERISEALPPQGEPT